MSAQQHHHSEECKQEEDLLVQQKHQDDIGVGTDLPPAREVMIIEIKDYAEDSADSQPIEIKVGQGVVTELPSRVIESVPSNESENNHVSPVISNGLRVQLKSLFTEAKELVQRLEATVSTTKAQH